MIKKTFEAPFAHWANTLDSGDIGENESGWLIEGKIHEDWFVWVNEFVAFHEKYGTVYGDFESEVYATSEEGYEHFVQNHPPVEWDYWDI